MAAKQRRQIVPPWLTRELVRRVGLGALALAMLAGAGVALYKFERFLIESPRFALRQAKIYGEPSPSIIVRGVKNASMDHVLDVFREDAGISLYLLPVEQRRQSLLAVDWVRNASVSRIWPNLVEVRVQERVPVAYVELENGMALIDRDGVLLGQPPRLDGDLPVIDGIVAAQSVESRKARVERALELEEEVGDLESRISRIDVSDPSNLSVEVTADDRAVLLVVGNERFRDKLLSFYENWPVIHGRLPNATWFDLRLDGRIDALNGVGK